MDRKKVLVTVPNTAWIHKHVVSALLKIQHDDRLQCTIMLPTHKPLENNQAKIQKDFLEGDYDFWLSIDSDNPPMNNPLDLVEFNLDVIGCPTPVWHDHGEGAPIYWNAMRDVGDEGFKPLGQDDMHGLQKVDAVGGGCWLIARRVLESLRDEQPFQRTWNPDGTVDVGNDWSFCRRAAAKGFDIYAHFGYPCRHFVELDLVEMTQAMVRGSNRG